jgi:hypothetical protein
LAEALGLVSKSGDVDPFEGLYRLEPGECCNTMRRREENLENGNKTGLCSSDDGSQKHGRRLERLEHAARSDRGSLGTDAGRADEVQASSHVFSTWLSRPPERMQGLEAKTRLSASDGMMVLEDEGC